jgi:hypothetical protein
MLSIKALVIVEPVTALLQYSEPQIVNNLVGISREDLATPGDILNRSWNCSLPPKIFSTPSMSLFRMRSVRPRYQSSSNVSCVFMVNDTERGVWLRCRVDSDCIQVRGDIGYIRKGVSYEGKTRQ